MASKSTPKRNILWGCFAPLGPRRLGKMRQYCATDSYSPLPWDVHIHVFSGFVLHDGAVGMSLKRKDGWMEVRRGRRGHARSTRGRIEVENAINLSLTAMYVCWLLGRSTEKEEREKRVAKRKEKKDAEISQPLLILVEFPPKYKKFTCFRDKKLWLLY